MRVLVRLAACLSLLSAAGTATPTVAGAATPTVAGAGLEPAEVAPPGFALVRVGPAGGTLWQGRIPNPLSAARRESAVYLPPGVTWSRRYPVVYLLHGMPGSPYSYVDSLDITDNADRLIAARRVPPFIAVMPAAGPSGRYDGEWTGIWERFLVDAVVPWADRELPAARSRAARTLAGLSAGGFGSVVVGLRHPHLFGTLESWSGYFRPLADGSLAGATRAVLASYDPDQLVQLPAASRRYAGLRFFLSAGTSDRASLAQTVAFAAELRRAGLRYELWLGPGGHDDRFWRSQLAPALRYALDGRPGRGTLPQRPCQGPSVSPATLSALQPSPSTRRRIPARPGTPRSPLDAPPPCSRRPRRAPAGSRPDLRSTPTSNRRELPRRPR